MTGAHAARSGRPGAGPRSGLSARPPLDLKQPNSAVANAVSSRCCNPVTTALGESEKEMRFVDRISLSTIAIITGAIANIGGAVGFILSGQMGIWIKGHPVVVFWIAIFINLILFSVFSGYQGRLQNRDERIATLTTDMASRERQLKSQIEEKDARIETLKHQSRTLELQFEEKFADQKGRLAALETENRELKALANHSERDRRLFQDVIDELSWQQGVIPYFDNHFDGKMWFDRNVDPLYEFNIRHRESYFDNQGMQASFKVLKEAASNLALWLAGEGAPFKENLYRIAPAENRDGGYEAFTIARNRGFELANALVDARRKFEQTGRQLRL
ncbi:hypothetical protein [Actinomadura welshii]|uniref:hypothetical protein n=1 Tax=Actinomadura welshii TaxID=3103817 RepID=UPI001F29B536|nr:hypothetical protein [Actinomadura madurae]